MTSLTAVILAAGQGTRMKSALPKVLHPLAGRPLVYYAVATATEVTGAPPVLVVGHGAGRVRAFLGDRARYAVQSEQLGTGHAVMQARELLQGQTDKVLVTYADMPLLSEGTLRILCGSHEHSRATLSLLTVTTADPRGFGRVVRDSAGSVQAIVEEADCTPEQRTIRELNAGIYCFDAAWLWENLSRLTLSRKGEYYLTDMVSTAVSQGKVVNVVECLDETEVLGINTRAHLAEAEAIMRSRINRRWMETGVTMLDPTSTYIDDAVTLGSDTTVLPGTYLQGQTVIGARCRIGPNTLIQDSRIADGCTIFMSVIEDAVLEADASIGPFTHLRKDRVSASTDTWATLAR